MSFSDSFKILCSFKNGEQKILDLEDVLDTEHKYVKNILDEKMFNQAKIGDFGQIFWNDAAKMKSLEGNLINCEYDISPEFVYENSVSV